MNSLSEKNIVITGASSGIGRQIAIEASKYSANIVLIARDADRLEETKRNLCQGKHLALPFDVTDYSLIEDAVSRIVAELGEISGFVHSAGIELTVPFKNMKPELYEKLFGVNVISGFEFARIISKKKYHNPDGTSFVFISSVMGKIGKEAKVGYCASKSALTSSVKAMALELASKRIRCNTIYPGVVKTELVNRLFELLPESSINEIVREHPLGLGDPNNIADLILFLLSDKSKWITGSEYVIDGGYSAK